MPATISQRLAEAAYKCVSSHVDKKDIDLDKYRTFALKFPSLVHTCGLAQSVAFAQTKEEYKVYLKDLKATLNAVESGTFAQDLENQSRRVPLDVYMRLSRRALMSADWLKRNVQALIKNVD